MVDKSVKTGKLYLDTLAPIKMLRSASVNVANS